MNHVKIRNAVLCLVISLISCTTVKPPLPGMYAHLKLPHIVEDHDLSLAACAAMVFQYYGTNINQYEVKSLSSDTKGMLTGVSFKEILHAASELGYEWKPVRYKPNLKGYDTGLQTIKDELDRGHPAIIESGPKIPNATFPREQQNTPYIDLPQNHVLNFNHAILVTGYDEEAQEITLMDPGRTGTGVRVVSYDRFAMIWHEEMTHYRFAILTDGKHA